MRVCWQGFAVAIPASSHLVLEGHQVVDDFLACLSCPAQSLRLDVILVDALQSELVAFGQLQKFGAKDVPWHAHVSIRPCIFCVQVVQGIVVCHDAGGYLAVPRALHLQ